MHAYIIVCQAIIAIQKFVVQLISDWKYSQMVYVCRSDNSKLLTLQVSHVNHSERIAILSNTHISNDHKQISISITLPRAGFTSLSRWCCSMAFSRKGLHETPNTTQTNHLAILALDVIKA